MTKEERLKKGSTIDEELLEEEAREIDKDMESMREDLEATKQLLDLELRSKRLIEKENKRLAQELEKLKNEVYKGAVNGMTGSEPQKDETMTAKASRRNSVATKRHSVIRLLSESEGHDNVQDKDAENGMFLVGGNGNTERFLSETR